MGTPPEGVNRSLYASRHLWFPALLLLGLAAAAVFRIESDPMLDEQQPWVLRWVGPFLAWSLAFALAVETHRKSLSSRLTKLPFAAYTGLALGATGLLLLLGQAQRAPGGVAIEGEVDQAPVSLSLLLVLSLLIACMFFVLHANGGRRDLSIAVASLVFAIFLTALFRSFGFSGDPWALFLILNAPLPVASSYRFLRPVQAARSAPTTFPAVPLGGPPATGETPPTFRRV